MPHAISIIKQIKIKFVLLLSLIFLLTINGESNQYIESYLLDDNYQNNLFAYNSLIDSLFPTPHSTSADKSTAVKVYISSGASLNPATVLDFKITGSMGGNYTGEINYDVTQDIIEIVPSNPFISGEVITVISKSNLVTNSNDTIKSFGWSFLISPNSGSGDFKYEKFVPSQGHNNFTVADLNRDKLPDIITYDNSYSRISILKNHPGMNFTDTLVLLGNAKEVCVEDYDNDGLQDIATLYSPQSNSIAILKQNQDGSFSQDSKSLSFSFDNMRSADINNDGWTDFVLYAYHPSNGIFIYKNTGDMNFEIAEQIFFTADLREFDLSDFDNDGDLDLIWGTFENQIYIAENEGDFYFLEPVSIGNGNPLKFLCQDLDSDGYSDVALLNSNSISFLRNQGNLSFSTAGTTHYIGSTYSFTFGDYDNDKDIDIAATTSETYFTLLTNNNNFSFSRSTKNMGSNRIASADFDNDGDIDLIFTTSGGMVISTNKNSLATLNLSSTSYNFNTIKLNDIKTSSFKIFNSGVQQTLEISDISSSNDVFSVSPKTGSVGPGDTLTVTISFKPTESLIYKDSLIIFSNDVNNTITPFYISGIGSQIISVSPTPNSTKSTDSSEIKVKFGMPLDPSTISDSSIKIFGNYSGFIKSSTITYNVNDSSITVVPENTFVSCERVTVTLTDKIKASDGKVFIPYTWDFLIQPKISSLKFRLKETLPIAAGLLGLDGKDIDEDGDIDLIVLSHDESKLFIYQNKGNWLFEKILELDGGFGASSFLVGDYDGDKDLDLVLTNITSSLIFYKNNGNLNFTPIYLNNVPGYLEMITQGDYDGDGDIDFASASSASDAQYNLIKNEGNFNFSIISYSREEYINSITSSDVDNDGDLDVVLSDHILRNEGNFEFISFSPFPGDKIKFIDADQDTDLDIIHPGSSGFSVLRNNGDLLYTSQFYASTSNSVLGLTINDLDGDGNEDLCTTIYPNLFTIFHNTGEIQYTMTSENILPDQSIVSDLKGFDLDNDNDNDLIFISIGGVLSVYENRDHFSELTLDTQQHNFGAVEIDSSKSAFFFIRNFGTLPLTVDTIISSNEVFSVTPSSGVISQNDSLQIALTFTPSEIKKYNDSLMILSSDEENPVVKYYLIGKVNQTLIESVSPEQNDVVLNCDTILVTFSEEVLQNSLNEGTIKIYGSKSGFHTCTLIYNESINTLQLLPSNKFIVGESVTVSITNGIQLASLNPVLNSFIWSFNIGVKDGSGRFIKMKNYLSGIDPTYPTGADLDNDGLEDIIISNAGTKNVSILKSIYGQGPVFKKNLETESTTFYIENCDFDEDGRIDIAVSSSNSLTIFKNLGNLSFSRYTVRFNSDSYLLTSGDYDGDGDIDIANLSYNNNRQYLRLMLNQGNFNFKVDSLTNITGIGQQLGSADFDNDGDIDILCIGESNNNFTLLKNNGELNFEKVFLPNLSIYVATMVIADFNSDGMVDIAAQQAGSNSAAILINDGELNFHIDQQPGITRNPIWLSGGDFDADGDIDLASIDNTYSPSGTVYLNNNLLFDEALHFSRELASPYMINGDFNGDGSLDLALPTNWMMNTGKKNYLLSSYSAMFENTKIGDSSNLNITLYNTGTDTLAIDSVYLINKYFQLNEAGFSVTPSDSFIIKLSFNPDSVFSYIDTLVISSKTPSYNKVLIEGVAVPPTDIESEKTIPTEYSLYQNFPNPFNPVTEIQYAIPFESNAKVVIYNIIGEVVKEYNFNAVQAGYYKLSLDASDLSSGIYIYTLISSSIDSNHQYKESKKMILLK